MSLEHAPTKQADRAAYTITEFCEAYRLSRGMLYLMWKAGTGPRWYPVGNQRRISFEAADDWRREGEARAAEAAA